MEEEPRLMEEDDEDRAARHGCDGDFSSLPEGCISHALSLTTPRDACRSAGASSAFRSAAASDTVWDRFLPPDLAAILSRSVDPVEFPSMSKRDLFFRLCSDPILVDGGKRSFSIDRATGKKCFMISAREMGIIWGDTPDYWRWISIPDSRFRECAELLQVWWLELHGRIDTRELSADTDYAAYLVFRIVDCVGDWESEYAPLVASVRLENGEAASAAHAVVLQSGGGERVPYERRWNRIRRRQEEGAPPLLLPPRTPRKREDGWMEVMVGEFYNKRGDDGELDTSLMETYSNEEKKGLLVHGMEFRPKKLCSSISA